MKILNLYAGLGGNRKLWIGHEVTAVELDPKVAKVYHNRHPWDNVVVGDAHDYLQKHFRNFDFVWSSPPCQTHSRMAKATRHKLRRYPDMKLYEEILFLQHFFKGHYVVENVKPFYTPLITPTVTVGRHNFWSSFNFNVIDIARPEGFITLSNLKGKQQMMDWLGIHFEERIYMNGNHCPVQVLRNCVHPEIGLQIIKQVPS